MNIKSNYIRFLIGERTLEDFGAEVGLSGVWIGQVLKIGRANYKTLCKIAKGLGVEPLTLVKED